MGQRVEFLETGFDRQEGDKSKAARSIQIFVIKIQPDDKVSSPHLKRKQEFIWLCDLAWFACFMPVFNGTGIYINDMNT